MAAFEIGDEMEVTEGLRSVARDDASEIRRDV
jgi:hypothetical protein